MVFGPIQCILRWHRRCHVFPPVFLAVSVDVHVYSFCSDIVPVLTVFIVIVPDDRLPLFVQVILELNDESGDFGFRSVVPQSFAGTMRDWSLGLSVVLSWRLRHPWSLTSLSYLNE